MFKTFHWFAGEGFELIVEDLLALPKEQPILVEGFRLLPRLVARLRVVGSGRLAYPYTSFPAYRFRQPRIHLGDPEEDSEQTRAGFVESPCPRRAFH